MKSLKPLFHLTRKKSDSFGSFKTRWLIKYGDAVLENIGFYTKSEVEEWIEKHDLEWRVAYLFRIKGDDKVIEIIDKNGKQPKF
jgi:hypothetical protein